MNLIFTVPNKCFHTTLGREADNITNQCFKYIEKGVVFCGVSAEELQFKMQHSISKEIINNHHTGLRVWGSGH